MSSNNRNYVVILSLVLVGFTCLTWGIVYNYKLSYETINAELETQSWTLLTALTEEKSKNADLKESILLSMQAKGERIPDVLRMKLQPHMDS